MRLWLKSKPREIIIVTVPRNKGRVAQLVEPLREVADNKIIILTAALANKRQQLMIGVKAARGEICALVDDDVYWSLDTVVPYLLAPFEDAEVGAVAGIQRLVNSSIQFLSVVYDKSWIIDIYIVLRSLMSAKMHESLQPGKPLRRMICIR